MEYTVIGGVKSRAMRVLWTLEELGQGYDHIPAPPGDAAARAHSATGKIPILLADGAVITDSAAIMTFLADRHGALTHPAGTVPRAHQDALFHRILDEMDALLWTAARHTFVLPEARQVPELKDSLRWEFQRNTDRLGEEMAAEGGPFLMGAEMTLPDILLAHCCGWAINARFPLEHPALRDHMARMRARPAFARAAGS
jgi:glutathione S-transferase